MAGDWISVHRQLRKNPIWKGEVFTRGQAWVDLLLLANWKPGHVRIRGVKINLSRGQLAGSVSFLADEWKWSQGKVRRFLDELEMEGQIEQQKNNVSTVVTITNYESYQQNGEQIEGQTESKQEGKRRANDSANGDTLIRNNNKQQETTKEREARPESLDDVLAYFAERGSNANEGEAFWDHFESNGWKVGGKATMKDWKASARGWLRRNFGKPQPAAAVVCRPPTDEELANYSPYG